MTSEDAEQRWTRLEQGRRLAGVDRRFDAVDQQLSEVEVGVQQIVGLLTDRDDS